jgi:CRISPR-associated protein Cas1
MNATGIPTPTWSGTTLSQLAGEPSRGAGKAGLARLQSIDTPPPASAPRFLHVVEPGATVRRAGGRLLVTKKDKVLLEVPAIKLQGVLLYGAVQISTPCVRKLLDEGIWLSFFTRSGAYLGRLQPPSERGGKLRLRQWEMSRNPEAVLAFSRTVVHGKILGQRLVAAAYAKNYLAETLGEAHQSLVRCLERLDQVKDLEELRGLEGTAARSYFELFRRWNRSEFPFDGRAKRGATDPLNVLLNFGYTLLTRELEGLLEAAGLDPTIGFYHQPDGDRPSLACDWIEEFRHPVIDRLVLRLVNRGTIKAADFEDRAERGLRLSPDGLRKYLSAYERALNGAGGGEEQEQAAPGLRGVLLGQLARLLDFLNNVVPYRSWMES